MPTPSLRREPWEAAEAEERRVWLAEQVELYLSAPEPGGRQPRNRHDVNDPLLLAPQKEQTSNLLWVLVFLGAEKNGTLPTNGKLPGGFVEVNK